MRVLIMPSWYSGKNDEATTVGVFHYEQALELQKNCDVAVYFPFDKTLKQEMSVENERGLLTYRSHYEKNHRGGNLRRVFKTFLRINKEFHPDIIHTHVAVEAGRFAVLLGLVFRKPVMITEHSTVEYSGTDKGIGKLYGKFIYSVSKCNVCVSEDLQYKLEKIFPKQRFCTIYNGILEPKLKSVRSQYRKSNMINIALVAILYSYDIKGIQFVIPALSELVKEGYHIALHIVGGGVCEDYFKDMAEEYGVSEYCLFYGHCEKQKVYEIINDMDFLISASLSESFGCTLAEAMMLGKPVLATKCGGPESFVNDEVGMLIEKGSTEAIIAGLKEMIEKYSKYDSEKIKQYAYDRFEMTSICNKYLDLYQKILK